MNYNIFDLYTSAVTGALALVLIFVTMPGNDQWRPFRRMNRLLVACCVVMCVANLVTSLLNVEDTGGIEMRVSMLIVSMYLIGVFGASFTAIASRAFSRCERAATPFTGLRNFDCAAHFTLLFLLIFC